MAYFDNILTMAKNLLQLKLVMAMRKFKAVMSWILYLGPPVLVFMFSLRFIIIGYAEDLELLFYNSNDFYSLLIAEVFVLFSLLATHRGVALFAIIREYFGSMIILLVLSGIFAPTMIEHPEFITHDAFILLSLQGSAVMFARNFIVIALFTVLMVEILPGWQGLRNRLGKRERLLIYSLLVIWNYFFVELFVLFDPRWINNRIYTILFCLLPEGILGRIFPFLLIWGVLSLFLWRRKKVLALVVGGILLGGILSLPNLNKYFHSLTPYNVEEKEIALPEACMLSWSKDGSSLYYVLYLLHKPNSHEMPDTRILSLYKLDLKKGTREKIAEHRLGEIERKINREIHGPSYLLQDGRLYLGFTKKRIVEREVWVCTPSGEMERLPIPLPLCWWLEMGASPNGRYVVVSNGDIWLYDTENKSLKRITDTEGDEKIPRVSADGKLVAFVREKLLAYPDDIYIKNVETGEEMKVGLGYQLEFAGDALIFTCGLPPLLEIDRAWQLLCPRWEGDILIYDVRTGRVSYSGIKIRPYSTFAVRQTERGYDIAVQEVDLWENTRTTRIFQIELAH